MKPLPVPYRSNPAAFKVGGEPRIINAYAEEAGNDNKADYILMPCAGMKTFGSELSGKCRGMIYMEDEDAIYAVMGIQVYKIDSAGSATSLGFIGGSDNVRMARNDAEPQQLAILSGNTVYFIEDDVLTVKGYSIEFTDGTSEDIEVIDITYCAGYFILGTKSGRFYFSDLQSNEVGDLSFATAEGNPDGLEAVHGEIDTLYLIGPSTTEVWGLVADPQLPFQRIGSAYLQIGTKSKHSVKTFNNAFAMIGADNVCYMVSGSQAVPFSSNEVTRLIEADANRAGIVAFTHQRGQNKFYTVQGSDWSREYNAKTGLWADRRDLGKSNWHCVHSAEIAGKKIFGDLITGQLFEADYDLKTDNSEPLEWGFYTQIIHDAPNGLSFDKIALDMETGGVAEYGTTGKVMLDWSDDGSRTWKGGRILSIGQKGEHNTRARANRLGSCGEKGRAFRVIVTDPVVRALAGLYGDVKGVSK